LIRSPITSDDSHYIDGYHYTTAMASRLTHLLRVALKASPASSNDFRILTRTVGEQARR
jgi:hypothetical protein